MFRNETWCWWLTLGATLETPLILQKRPRRIGERNLHATLPSYGYKGVAWLHFFRFVLRSQDKCPGHFSGQFNIVAGVSCCLHQGTEVTSLTETFPICQSLQRGVWCTLGVPILNDTTTELSHESWWCRCWQAFECQNDKCSYAVSQPSNAQGKCPQVSLS